MSGALARAGETDAGADGGLHCLVAGAPVVCRPSGALWCEAQETLAVADLHLEKGSAFAARGQLLPPYDTADTMARLEAEVAALRPAVVVLLGDSFHDGDGEDRLTEGAAQRLHALAAGRTLVWITGNHDRTGPRRLAGRTAESLTVGPFTFRHEPTAGPAPGEVAGHLHPCAKLAGRGAAVRRRCFATDGARMVLPAFGAYAGGLNLRDRAFRPLFGRPPWAVMLGAGRTYAVRWDQLRSD